MKWTASSTQRGSCAFNRFVEGAALPAASDVELIALIPANDVDGGLVTVLQGGNHAASSDAEHLGCALFERVDSIVARLADHFRDPVGASLERIQLLHHVRLVQGRIAIELPGGHSRRSRGEQNVLGAVVLNLQDRTFLVADGLELDESLIEDLEGHIQGCGQEDLEPGHVHDGADEVGLVGKPHLVDEHWVGLGLVLGVEEVLSPEKDLFDIPAQKVLSVVEARLPPIVFCPVHDLQPSQLEAVALEREDLVEPILELVAEEVADIVRAVVVLVVMLSLRHCLLLLFLRSLVSTNEVQITPPKNPRMRRSAGAWTPRW